MKKLTVLIIILSLIWGCISQNKMKREALIKAISDSVDFKLLPEKIMYIVSYRYDYGDYDLYRLGGFEYFFGGVNGEDLFPHDIAEVNGKYLFFYPPFNSGKTGRKETKKKSIEIVEETGIPKLKQRSKYTWYVMQSRLTGKCTVVRAVNTDIESYEIPEVRTVLSNQPSTGDIDIVACNNCFVQGDVHGTLDVPFTFPVSFSSIFTIYNRKNSCLYWGEPDSLGYFAWVNGRDTLYLNAKEYYLEDKYIDDPDYNYDSQKAYRFEISSGNAYPFFSKLPMKDFHQHLYSLMRDSVFYIPNVDRYKAGAPDSCYYPKQKIKVMFPVECGFKYRTSDTNYYYEKGNLIR